MSRVAHLDKYPVSTPGKVWRLAKLPLAFVFVFLFGWKARSVQANEGLLHYKAEMLTVLLVATGAFMVTFAVDHYHVHRREGMKERFTYFVPIFFVAVLGAYFIPKQAGIRVEGVLSGLYVIGAIVIAAVTSWWFVYRDPRPFSERERFEEDTMAYEDGSFDGDEFDATQFRPGAGNRRRHADVEPKVFSEDDDDFEMPEEPAGRPGFDRFPGFTPGDPREDNRGFVPPPRRGDFGPDYGQGPGWANSKRTDRRP